MVISIVINTFMWIVWRKEGVKKFNSLTPKIKFYIVTSTLCFPAE